MARPIKLESGKGNPEWTQQEILKFAVTEFSIHGYEGGSLRNIAKQVGVGNATLLHHFGSKAGIYIAVLELLKNSLNDVLNQLLQQPADSQLERLINAISILFDWAEQSKELASIAVADMFIAPIKAETDQVYQSMQPFFEGCRDYILGSQEESSIRQFDIRMVILNALMIAGVGEAVQSRSEAVFLIKAHEFKKLHKENTMYSLILGMAKDQAEGEKLLKTLDKKLQSTS